MDLSFKEATSPIQEEKGDIPFTAGLLLTKISPELTLALVCCQWLIVVAIQTPLSFI